MNALKFMIRFWKFEWGRLIQIYDTIFGLRETAQTEKGGH